MWLLGCAAFVAFGFYVGFDDFTTFLVKVSTFDAFPLKISTFDNFSPETCLMNCTTEFFALDDFTSQNLSF